MTSKSMILLVSLVIGGFWLVAPAQAEFYKYTDQNGVVHFTDNLSEVPEDQRPDLKTYETSEDDLTPQELAKKRTERQKAISEQRKAALGDHSRLSPESADTLDEVRELTRERAALDAEYEALIKERDELAAVKPENGSEEEVVAHNEKVVRLNERIKEYEKKRKAFADKVAMFNSDQNAEAENSSEGAR